MSEAIKLPGAIGETISLNCAGATTDPPSDEPFRIGDVIGFGPTTWRYRVTAVAGDRVYFERIA